jgi:hypothetical protein
MDNDVPAGCASQPTIFEEGRTAWGLLKQHQNWSLWRRVGLAMAAGQAEAMVRARTNQPKGKRYHEENGAFLSEYGFDSIDKGARSRLLEVMRKLPPIEAWLEKQPPAKRIRLNHPQAVLSAWKRSEGEKKPQPDPKSELCAIWKNASVEEGRAALEDGGVELLYERLSPAMRKEIELRLANPHTGRRLAKKDAEEKQTVAAAKKETDKRAPKLGNVTSYNESKKAKRTKAKTETAKPKDIGQWRKFPREKLQAVYDQERQRMETEHLNVRELKRLEEMRERLAVNGNDVPTEQSTAAMMAAHAAADADQTAA